MQYPPGAYPASPQPPQPPPPKKGLSGLSVFLIVLAVVVVMGLGTCAAGLFWLKGKAEGVIAEIGDGGTSLVLASPPAVKAALAAGHKDYVGDWRSAAGTELRIDATGDLKFAKSEAGHNETYNAPIAGFAGNDIELKIMIRVVLTVSRPPHKVGDHWEMTVDGIALTRK